MGTIKNEELRVNVIVNGNSAHQELTKLEEKHLKLVEHGKVLRSKQAELLILNKKNTKEYKNVTKEIKKNTDALKNSQSEIDVLVESMSIKNLSVKQLNNRLSTLALKIKALRKGSERNKLVKEYQAVERQLQKLEFRTDKIRTRFQRMADSFNRYQTMMFVATGTIISAYKATDDLMKKKSELADQISMVEKTTNLTNKQVTEMYQNLNKIDTRTPKLELLKLAEQAGRLGKDSVEDVMAFTEVANEIKVSLGDDLSGDTEKQIRVIGKLTEIYKVGKEDGLDFADGMTMIGSAINEVSNAGPAQADFMVDYLKRLAGVSQQTRITAQDQLGFAAVLDESGQSVEVSGTAMSKVILDMFKKTHFYANIAGVGVKDFSKLLEEDTNEAVLLFLKGLNSGGDGLKAMSKHLDGLGLDGTRVISVLTTLASQTDKVREKQDLANISLQNATSLHEEYEKKNKNFAAIVDKIHKRFMVWLLDSKLVKGLEDFVELLGELLNVSKRSKETQEMIDRYVFFFKLISIGLVALGSYHGALKLITLWEKRSTAAIILKNIALKASNIVWAIQSASIAGANGLYQLLTLRIGAATTSFRVMTTAMNVNPFVLLATVVTTLGAAYMIFREENEKLTRAQQIDLNVKEKVANAYLSEEIKIKRLVKLIKDQNQSLDAKKIAFERLKQIAPGYLNDLDLEEGKYLKINNAMKSYLQNKKNELKAKVLEEEYVKILKEVRSIEQEKEEDEAWYVGLPRLILSPIDSTANFEESKKLRIAEQMKLANEIEEEIKKLNPGDKDKNDNLLDKIEKLKNDFDTDLNTHDKKTIDSDPENDPKVQQEQELRRFLSEWVEEHDLQEKLKTFERDERAFEEKLLREEQKWDKQIELATGNADLIEELEEAKLISLQDIRDAYAEEEIAKAELKQEKLRELEENDSYYNSLDAENQERYKEIYSTVKSSLTDKDIEEKKAFINSKKLHEKEIKSIQSLENAKRNARQQGVQVLKQMVKGNKDVFRVLFLAEKGLAAGEIIASASKAIATATANEAMIPAILPPGVPNPAKPISMASTAKNIAAVKINSAAQLSSLIATTIEGFEEGYYPVKRKQDGKLFNAEFGGNMNQTQLIKKPTILTGETMPELIVSGPHLKDLEMNYPHVVETIYKTIPGYEVGYYGDRNNDETVESNDDDLIRVLSILAEKLSKPISANLNYRLIKNREKKNSRIETMYES